MDFNFTEEQNMIRDSLSRLIREQYDFDTRRKVVESEAGWRPEMWAQFAELGLLMAPFSEEDGGLGGGPIDAMVVMEEFGKGLVVEPYVPSVVCGGGFLKRGTDAQKEEYLSGIMSGENIFAFAYAEPRGRYNLADLETTAKKDGAGFVLNGHKAVVIGAPWATHFVVTARTSGDRRDSNGVSVFVVAKDAQGVSTRDYPTVDGRRASEVYFENVAVGAEAVIDRGDLPTFVERVLAETKGQAIDAVMDLVGGEMTDLFIDTMIGDMHSRATYPRLSIAGASGGNLSEIMWTRVYLYQVQIFGVSHGTREEAEQLVAWIRSGELKPVLHGAFKLSELHQAERYFVNRGSNYLGKIVIVPDAQWDTHGAPFAITTA